MLNLSIKQKLLRTWKILDNLKISLKKVLLGKSRAMGKYSFFVEYEMSRWVSGVSSRESGVSTCSVEPRGGHAEQAPAAAATASTWAAHRGPFMCEGGGLRAQRSIRAGRGRAVPGPPRDASHAYRRRRAASPWPPSTDDGARPHPTRAPHRVRTQHEHTRHEIPRSLVRHHDKVRKSISKECRSIRWPLRAPLPSAALLRAGSPGLCCQPATSPLPARCHVVAIQDIHLNNIY